MHYAIQYSSNGCLESWDMTMINSFMRLIVSPISSYMRCKYLTIIRGRHRVPKKNMTISDSSCTPPISVPNALRNMNQPKKVKFLKLYVSGGQKTKWPPNTHKSSYFCNTDKWIDISSYIPIFCVKNIILTYQYLVSTFAHLICLLDYQGHFWRNDVIFEDFSVNWGHPKS